MGFFKMRCGKRGVVSLFMRSATLYCATCRGAQLGGGLKSFSGMSKNVLVVGVSHDAMYHAVATVRCGRA